MHLKVLLFSLTFFFFACSNDEQPKTKIVSNKATKKSHNVKDTKLTKEKLLKYKEVASALISLDEEFLAALSKAENVNQKEIDKKMQQARDELCKRFQMTGYDEFLWIERVALSDPKNKELAATVGIHIP